MRSLALDTYKTIQKLQTKGFSLEQAEGVVEALTESELVTKSDLTIEVRQAVSDIKVWVVLMLLAQAALIVTIQNLLS